MLKKVIYRLSIFKALSKYYAGAKKLFVVNMITSIIYELSVLINPIFYKIFIDEVILQSRIEKISVVITGYLLLFVCKSVIEYIKLYCNNKLTNRCMFLLRMKIWNNIFKKEFVKYFNLDVSEYKLIIENDINIIEQYTEKHSTKYLIDTIAMMFCVIMLWVIDWRLTILSVIVVPLTFFIDYHIGKKEAVILENDRKRQHEQTRWLLESLQGWKEIKALNLYKIEIKKYKEFVNREGHFYSKWNLLATTRKLVLPKLKDEFFMQFSIYFIGGFMILHHEITIGSLLVFMKYYDYFSGKVRAISDADAELLANDVKCKRIFSAVQELESDSGKNGVAIDYIKSIEMRNIYFTYETSKDWLLNNFNFTIKSGERVALVGRSGAGKSTVIKLLLGILQAQNGTILYNDIRLDDLQISMLHKKLGIVMQENLMFSGTIKENLLLGKINANEEECIEACKMAHIYDFIKNLPDGFETLVGENGIRLSGGQKQRIILARVFLADVDVYILDEATSALDQNNENLIFEALNNIKRDKIVLVVSHRKASIELCDRVIYI